MSTLLIIGIGNALIVIYVLICLSDIRSSLARCEKEYTKTEALANAMEFAGKSEEAKGLYLQSLFLAYNHFPKSTFEASQRKATIENLRTKLIALKVEPPAMQGN